MEAIRNGGDDSLTGMGGDIEEYRESIKKLIDAQVKNALEEEMQNAAKELIEEQRKALKHILEEQKMVIREVVEDEKKAIWARAEALRQSILKLSL